MGKHLMANAYSKNLTDLTESEVTTLTSLMVNKAVLAILKSQRSEGIKILSSQWKSILDI
jgi:hypothetical protein